LSPEVSGLNLTFEDAFETASSFFVWFSTDSGIAGLYHPLAE
jgi:hypothetical protein